LTIAGIVVMGVDLARAALAAGHLVVATGRDPKKVVAAVGESERLLAVTLDITDLADAQAAARAAVDRFGRIDVLVNNAGNFVAGFFEEINPDDFRAQVETNLFGPLNVTRAVLPVMRAQRSGLVVTVSSTAGLAGGEFLSAYAATKFALEGWMESLAPEVAPFGIRTMSSSPASSAPNSSPRNRRATRNPRSTTMRTGPGRPSRPGTGCTGGRAVTRPDSPTRWCSWPVKRSRRCAGRPARTLSGSSSRRPNLWSIRPTPTASCRHRWRSMTPR
jgi:NAD(P)-dependent dehydrogenase (short-subunit alcohol dehydrogenase family)